MADKPTPEEDIPPRERSERLVSGSEPAVFQSSGEDSPDDELPERPAETDSKGDSTEPPAAEPDESVLERFDALKQRLAGTPVPPSPPLTPGGLSSSQPEEAQGTPIGEPTPEAPSLGGLGEQFRSIQRAERESASELDEQPPTPFESSREAPSTDDLEPLKMEEAAERRKETRKAKRKARRQNRSFWKELPVLILVSIVVAIVIKTFFFQAFYIPSASMVSTLEVNDRVLVNKLSYRFGSIERGDILVFDSPEAVDVERSLAQRIVRRVGEATGLVSPDTVLIKRVIGLPGETVEVRDNQVYVNDSPIAEPYLADGVTTRDMDVITVPADHVFMMGDNRNQSRDSRVFGPISRDDVVGRAFVRVWPASRWGGL